MEVLMKMHEGWFSAALKLLAGITAAVVSSSALALYVEEFAIGDWSSATGPAACDTNPADNRSAWPGMADAWYNQMGAFGHFKAGRWVNGYMTKQHECDPSYNASCLDYWSWSGYGYDWADAAIAAYHGSPVGTDYWAGLQRYSFSADGDCWVRAGNSGQTHFGDQWLKFFIASSCFSADGDTLPNIRLAMAKSGAALRSHQWDGFHGIMWISGSFNGNYQNTAWDGHFVPISTAWVTNHHKKGQFDCAAYDPFNWFGTCKDQCPIAYSIGTNGTDALNRLLNERYNFVMSNPGGNGGYAWMYYPGCKPEGKPPF
jgi:hypothetical protein